MKKSIFNKTSLLIILLFFVTLSAKSQFYNYPYEKNLGCITNNQDISFDITVTNLGAYPDGNSFSVSVENSPESGWLSVSPSTFTLYAINATQTVTVTGQYPSDWTTNSGQAIINIVDNNGSAYTSVYWSYCGPGGVEDYITITQGDYEFSENDALYYKAEFTDYDPVQGDPDFITNWYLNMTLHSTDGDYTYQDLSQTYDPMWTDWSFNAPVLPNNLQFYRNSEGKIFGTLTIKGLDNDGILHEDSREITINKEPNQPDLYPIPNSNTSVMLYFLDSHAEHFKVYYDTDTGLPYNGTGLLQGDSPIDAGNTTSIQVDGLAKCTPYYFSAKGTNDFGESSFAEERKIMVFDAPNAMPVQYYLNDFNVDIDYSFVGNQYFTGDLIIQSGATVTFQGGYQYFDENSKIIIEPGGQLILDGATCTAPCGQTWQGIEVRGNAAEDQFEYTGHPLAQGKLVLKNNASIQNAWNAVTTWKEDDWSTTGGIVLASNSSFINNKRSVEFMSYQNHYPTTGEPAGYISRFSNCEFVVNDDFLMPDFNSHITMCNVDGIRIEGCEFANNITNAQHTGQGIYTIDAGYRVTAYCNATIQPCPDTSITRTTFSNFYAGIISLNSQSTNTPYVNNAEFNNNGIGIQLNAVDNATVIFNDFYIGQDTYDSCFAYEFGIGIYLNNSNGYAIEENHFYPAQGMTSDAIGVNVYYNPKDLENPVIMHNEIYKNSFDSVYIGNNTQGDNFNQDQRVGLVHLCNGNNNNTYDFYITDQGINYLQGSLDEPAGNTFSLNANNPYSDYNNQSDWSITYFYKETTPETPVSYSGGTFFPIGDTNTNQCLSHYGDITKQNKGLGLSASQLQYFTGVYNANNVDYIGTKALYESLKDGGNTPGTITDVENAWPDEMWETRNDLLAKSPHLTREVLVETANRTDLFPDAVIFEILSANPDAMKDKSLLEYLQTKENPLPQYMIDILAGTPGNITYKTILESDLSRYGGNKSRAANIIIRNLLNDSIVNTDSLTVWLKG